MMAGLQQMPSNAKEVLHESMHGQELLRLSRRFKLPHLSFPMSRRLMRDFGSIVSVLVGVVDDGGHDLAVSGAVAFQLVGDQPPGRASLPLQQLAEESFGGFPRRRMSPLEFSLGTRPASRWEAAQIPNEADDGGRGQKSDAGNGEKSLHLRKLLGERLELVLDASALVLELSNLGARITQVRTEHVGQIRISVFDELGDGGHDEVSALGDAESELAQDPAYGIDACGPCGEPS